MSLAQRAWVLVWCAVLGGALSSAGCGARTALGLSELGSSAGSAAVAGMSGVFHGAGSGGASGSVSGASSSSGASSHAGASPNPSDAGPLAMDAAPPSDAGSGPTDDAGGPTCDPNAGLVQTPTGCFAPPAPRQLAPLSTSTVTSRRPTFHWLLAPGTDGAHVKICRDRLCAAQVLAFDALKSSGAPPVDLPTGALFWQISGRIGSVTGKAASLTWEVFVGARSAPVDTSWGTTLDVNEDGFADVIIGAPDVGTGSPGIPPGTGHAYLFLGSKAGLVTSPATTLVGVDGTNALFGSVAASAGDVNGDGYADVIVSAPWANGYSGHAYVYLGSASGLATSPASSLLGPGTEGAEFGITLASAGDLNGDGYADVIVGAPLLRTGPAPSPTQYVGRAYVYFGSATGIASTPSLTLAGPEVGGTKFANVVASAGDLNGDGYADLMIAGQPYIPIAGGALQDSSAYYVYHGAASGLAATPTLELTNQSQQFTSVAGGCDLNGDGYADLAIDTTGSTSAAIYFGSAAGIGLLPNASLAPQYGSGSYNYDLSPGGDINGDGYADLVTNYDQVFVYSGSATGLLDSPLTFTPSQQSSGIYGYSVNQVGDFNGDGYGDIVVGSRSDSSFAGRAFVFLGGPGGLSTTPAAILPGPDGPGGEFG